ncbi:alpha/beta-hydrolase [Periconia macrospinosa]|uniref:Carboxylic ester hydrolase n=1 Tax=Periconia macrospinosa TaxID=97972 RepID=A0A2V1DUA7_9PLEO|nr:alpha/beta-hydrolase [Periconia macrospinosa]
MFSLGTLSLFSACVAVASELPTATINAGPIVGTTTSFPSSSTTVNKFLGVPFAAPPKRFTPAENPKPWTEPLDTKNASAACIQQFRLDPEDFRNFSLSFLNDPVPEESEDCLYLNVYAPASPAPPGGRAVMFWIYGGGLFAGYASHPMYDGSHFAAFEDVIVVAANYRTNIFGFPNSPVQNRNLGFLDQRLALSWVQNNIHAFGGSPSKVTIFGESAGSWSVDALLTSHAPSTNTTPPFRAAIMESGVLGYRGSPAPGLPFPSSSASWDTMVNALNCTASSEDAEFTCVQNAPAGTIKDIGERQMLLFNPIHDNETLVSDIAARRKTNNIAQVPLLIGTNKDEGTLLAGLFFNNVSMYLETTFGARLTPTLRAEIEKTYPLGSAAFPTPFDVISAIETDISMQCGTAFTTLDSADSRLPTWRYFYNATFPSTSNPNYPTLDVYHGSEIPLVFTTYPLSYSPKVAATLQQNVLSTLMRGAWARFAKDPISGPGWNKVGSGQEFFGGEKDEDVAVLGEMGVRVERRGIIDERCGVWERVLRGVV